MKRERRGFKVVTEDMESLGLRKNPNIMEFPVNEWIELSQEDIEEGRGDWGGIWVARNRGGANTLVKYMKDKYNKDCLIYECLLGDILFENSYRIKTDKVFLIEEEKDKVAGS